MAEALREFIDEADTFRGDVTVIADARGGDDIGDTLTKETRLHHGSLIDLRMC